jgi:predicted tellurium resistance membrane protein TerC
MTLPGLADPETWVALLSLVAMELVLGIDNIVFITILTGRLPESQRERTARLGIGLALVLRIALLFAIGWVMSLTEELTRIGGVSVTGKSLILFGGGLFLIAKAVLELHKKLDEHDDAPVGTSGVGGSQAGVVLAQILALDLVFSLDSVITAVGMIPPEQIWVMVVAILASVVVMLLGARPIGDFVTRHPTMKVLALAFLVLIGVMLVAEGVGNKIPKGYVYFAMAFALGVELVNLRVRKRAQEKAKA